MRKKAILLAICLILLTGCGGNASENTQKPEDNTTTQNSEINTEQQSESTEITTETETTTESQAVDSETETTTESQAIDSETETNSEVESENQNVSTECKHNFSEATCTTPSTCSKCSMVEGEALGHDVQDADCTHESTCKRCGKKVGGALGHDYVAATCTKPETCSVCGAVRGTAKGHVEVVDNAIAATCTTEGKTRGIHCAVCNIVITKQEIIEKKEHSYDKTGVCRNCQTLHNDAKIVIEFNDFMLKQAIAEELGKESNETITKYDMSRLDYISLPSSVSDIEPLKYAINMTRIFIPCENCKNLSILCELKNLKTVQIGYQSSIDVTFMKNMLQIEEVYYNGAQITNGTIEDLLVSPNLKKVYFQRYNGDLDIFVNHPTIEELDLTYCIDVNTDISPLLEIPKLKKLEVWSPHEEISDEQYAIYEKLSNKGVSVTLD